MVAPVLTQNLVVPDEVRRYVPSKQCNTSKSLFAKEQLPGLLTVRTSEDISATPSPKPKRNVSFATNNMGRIVPSVHRYDTDDLADYRNDMHRQPEDVAETKKSCRSVITMGRKRQDYLASLDSLYNNQDASPHAQEKALRYVCRSNCRGLERHIYKKIRERRQDVCAVVLDAHVNGEEKLDKLCAKLTLMDKCFALRMAIGDRLEVERIHSEGDDDVDDVWLGANSDHSSDSLP